MLKKLQNLLFEDEDENIDDEELDEEEEVVSEPVKVEAPVVKPVETRTEVKKAEPVVLEKPAESHFNRIDMTGTMPVQNSQPKQQAPVSFPEEPKQEVKKSSIGITVDDDYKAPKQQQPVKPVAKQQIKPAKPKTQKPAKKASKSGYEFQPVISPIFGVDEKDMTALKNTTKKVVADTEEDDGNITPVISPIYGSTQTNVVKPRADYVEETPSVKNDTVENTTSIPVEDEIPDFSLDDILKVRDEQYDTNENFDNTAPLFPDLSFPEEPEEIVEPKVEEEPDQTMVIKKVSK